MSIGGVKLKEVSVTLEKVRLKDILVTTPCKGSREVFYVDELSPPSSSSSPSTMKLYEDWRLETIPSFPSRKRKRKRGASSTITSNSAKTFQISRDFPAIFQVEWADGNLHSILDLLGGGPMSWDVMDGYFLSRLQKYRERKSPRLTINFQYLSVYFTPVKSREQPPSEIQADPHWAPQLTPKDLQECVLLAPQYICKHFYLAVFNFPRKSISVFDSSWHYIPMPLREGQVQAVLKSLAPQDHLEWTLTFKTNSSPQYDEFSCGSYAIFYAQNLLKWGEGPKADKANSRELSNERVVSIRKGIAKELLMSTAIGLQFLEAISD